MKPILAILGILIVVTSIMAGMTAAQPAYINPMHTCAISTGHGLLKDMDCDRIPDLEDNCPNYNPGQKDSNNDGFGDACAEMFGKSIHKKTGKGIRVKQQAQEFNSYIKVIEAQDVVIGGPGAVYPVKITNSGPNTEKYVISIEGVDFGTYRIDPASTVEVLAGETQTVYINIAAEAGEGQESFVVTVDSGSGSEQVAMIANLVNRGKTAMDYSKVLEAIGWLLVLIVLLILVFIVSREFQRKRPKKVLEEELYSYY